MLYSRGNSNHNHMIITMQFYTTWIGKFHDRRHHSGIFYRINIIDIMGCCTPVHSVTTTTWQLSCSSTYNTLGVKLYMVILSMWMLNAHDMSGQINLRLIKVRFRIGKNAFFQIKTNRLRIGSAV